MLAIYNWWQVVIFEYLFNNVIQMNMIVLP